ncbi:heavy metal translocating P-type ATPase [Aliarcobacter thereius]|uniref:Copper-transporting ATPase n=1 Tax=Aliarcobacter thereius LMG 24486 TaxID=1032240 RepID=A0A1C7WLX7_9BACT|nr:heavy metal translocating P-type ATPase [Aliarcobacter thereius]OCL94619.1 putative copper-importing P-type ATPase A [Aliarcobacter thereius LMG 24486]QBF15504.1 cytochrome oxidase maturation protein, cbb3-type [Aliarcobacter thereius LMG 24486]TLS91729.1 heavy metal translocating P-type ATPase [Aliarcobacter thereius]
MSKIVCNHCHLSFEESVMIKDGDMNFCCGGCQTVFHILKEENLDSFYEKLGNKSIKAPLQVSNRDLEKFDSQNFLNNYTTKTKDGFTQIDLILEGIHCAACVWLNEKILYDTKGVVEADINFTTNKARVIFNRDLINLSQIIKKIRSIGYNAYAYDSTLANEQANKAKQDFFVKIMVAVVCTMNIMMLSVGKYTGFFTGMSNDVKDMIHFAEFILTTPVLFYSGFVFYKGAYYGIKNRIVNMDLLVSTGASLTYLYSLSVLFGAKGESYFDSVAMIITFVLIGKYLEVIGKKSAIDTLDKIKSTLPLETTVVKDGIKEIKALNEIEIGDIVEIKIGEKVPVDGKIVFGSSSFDESSLTGESIPVYKKTGDTLYSGTIILDSLVHYEVTKDFKNSTFSSIVTLLEDSLNSKPKIQTLANQLSRGFSLIILSIAFATFLVWYYFGLDLGFYFENTNQFERSFITAVSVVVIACPCALALATPMASLVGISELAKKSLLFKEAKYIETLANANLVVFDKTGTLTKGELEVSHVDFFSKEQKNIDILYSLLDSSTHPVSLAVKRYIEDNFEIKTQVLLEEIQNVEAKGLKAKYEDIEVLGGNQALIDDFNIDFNSETKTTQYIFAIGNKVIANFELKDEIKDDAKELIDYLKSQNIDIMMLTGDNDFVAKNVANSLEIKNYKAHLSPKDKAEFIKLQKDSGKIVVMVGDGVNDSVALSFSDVAIAMGNGADVSMMVSDIVLLSSKLKSLKDAFIISKKTYKHIKQNLSFSLIYNALTIPIAMSGYIIPLFAALSMSLSSLVVVFNSLRIRLK